MIQRRGIFYSFRREFISFFSVKDAIFVAEVFFYAKFVKLYMFVPGQSLVYGQAGSPGWTDINIKRSMTANRLCLRAGWSRQNRYKLKGASIYATIDKKIWKI